MSGNSQNKSASMRARVSRRAFNAGVAASAIIANTLKSPSVREKLALQGAEILLKGPDEFTVYLNADAKRMLQLIQAAGMTAQ